MEISTEKALNPQTKTIKISAGEFTLKPFTLRQVGQLQKILGGYSNVAGMAMQGSSSFVDFAGDKLPEVVEVLLGCYPAAEGMKDKIDALSVAEVMSVVDVALEVSQIDEIKRLFLSAATRLGATKNPPTA